MLAQRAEHERLQIEFRQLQRGRLGLPGAERQQVLDQPLQFDAVFPEYAGHFLLLPVELADRAVEQQLGALADICEWRLQLVRHMPQEFVLLLARFRQTEPQPFELAAERLEVGRT